MPVTRTDNIAILILELKLAQGAQIGLLQGHGHYCRVSCSEMGNARKCDRANEAGARLDVLG